MWQVTPWHWDLRQEIFAHTIHEGMRSCTIHPISSMRQSVTPCKFEGTIGRHRGVLWRDRSSSWSACRDVVQKA